MNIETLNSIIEDFESQIVETGFKRDVQDYVNSMPNNQNNIVSLRDIANKVYETLTQILEGDLPELLPKLLIKDKPRPFTESDFYDKLHALIDNKEIDQAQFFAQLQQILTQLNQRLQENINEINSIKAWIKPYLTTDQEEITAEEKALISIIFKDTKTITNLKEFTKVLSAWNRILPIYHQVLTSDSPDDIQIAAVQNGSIDIVVNLDIDLAVNLVDLFNVGFKCYAAYLSYKKIIKPITQAFSGNKELESDEKNREKKLLKNIPIEIERKALEQHKTALKKDNNIDKNPDKKIEQIVKLVNSHIVNGNDIKLLTYPEPEHESDSNEIIETKRAELLETSIKVRKALRELPQEEHQKLLKQFGEIDEEEGK